MKFEDIDHRFCPKANEYSGLQGLELPNLYIFRKKYGLGTLLALKIHKVLLKT